MVLDDNGVTSCSRLFSANRRALGRSSPIHSMGNSNSLDISFSLATGVIAVAARIRLLRISSAKTLQILDKGSGFLS